MHKTFVLGGEGGVLKCHMHNNKIAKLDTVILAEQFISRSPIAGKRVFGSFCDI